jgi:hypothetical protein
LKIKHEETVRPAALAAIAILTSCLPLTCVLRAQDADSAKHFLESAYRRYNNHGSGLDFTGPVGKQYFHSSLIALIRADEKAAGPDMAGALDGDPLCGCQDWDGIYDLRIAIHPQDSAHAQADVSFSLFKSDPQSRRSLVIDLIAVDTMWRIYNITDKSDPKNVVDFRDELKKDIESLSQSRKPESRK